MGLHCLTHCLRTFPLISILYNLNGCRNPFFLVSSANGPDALHFMRNDSTLPWTYLIWFVLSSTLMYRRKRATLLRVWCMSVSAGVCNRVALIFPFYFGPAQACLMQIIIAFKQAYEVNIMHPGSRGDAVKKQGTIKIESASFFWGQLFSAICFKRNARP